MSKLNKILKPKSKEELKKGHWKYIYEYEIKFLGEDSVFLNKISKGGKEIIITNKIRTSESILKLSELLDKKVDLEYDEIRLQGYYFNTIIWTKTDWKKNGKNITYPNSELYDLDPFTDEEIEILSYGLTETG